MRENYFDYGLIKSEKFNISYVYASVRGRKHIKNNIENQDYGKVDFINGFGVASIADGLGSCLDSSIGSKFAVEAAIEVLDEYLNLEKASFFMKLIPELIVERWKSKVDNEKIRNYDSTLLFAALKDNNVFLGGIGDGMLQYSVNNEEPVEILKIKEEFSNQTNSIGMNDSNKYFVTKNIEFSKDKLPLTVVLATDGIVDDLTKDGRTKLSHILTNKMLELGPEKFADELNKWVLDWVTPNHTDDRTIAVITIWNEEVCYE